MAKAGTKIDDRRLRKHLKNLRQQSQVSVKVGIFGQAADQRYPDGSRVGTVAAAHEMGAGVPRRSWLRDWASLNRTQIQQRVESGFRGLVDIDRADVRGALAVAAAWAVGDIQRRIAEGIAPALDPSTIAAKGSSTPLIDTGILRQSIAWEIDG